MLYDGVPSRRHQSTFGGNESPIYRGSGRCEKLELYEIGPVRQPVTDLAPKLSDMADEDVKDSP